MWTDPYFWINPLEITIVAGHRLQSHLQMGLVSARHLGPAVLWANYWVHWSDSLSLLYYWCFCPDMGVPAVIRAKKTYRVCTLYKKKKLFPAMFKKKVYGNRWSDTSLTNTYRRVFQAPQHLWFIMFTKQENVHYQILWEQWSNWPLFQMKNCWLLLSWQSSQHNTSCVNESANVAKGTDCYCWAIQCNILSWNLLFTPDLSNPLSTGL